MNSNPSFETISSTASNKRGAFSFIFLSLILLILCFFIKIISVSNFEQIKIDAVATSVQSAFQSSRSKLTFFHPSFMPAGSVLTSQELFRQSFEEAQIHQSWNGQTLFVTLPEQDVFQPFQETLTPKAKHFFHSMALFLQTHPEASYEIGLTHYIDLLANGNYPLYSHLAARRAQKIAEYWVSLDIPEQAVHVGFEKGDAGVVSIFLTFTNKEGLDADRSPQ